MLINKTQFTSRCPVCGDRSLSAELVQSAMWHRGHLIVIRNIPALVCATCGERLFGDATAAALDMMVGEGLTPEDADEVINVPVYAFEPLGSAVPPGTGSGFTFLEAG